ncbi:MAG TPA: ComF family protein [bacterium]|nr:ComF family protein [bacterium]HNS48370.1 ComF family protein [bacterium]
MHPLLEGLLDLVYPPACVGCRRRTGSSIFCPDCAAKIERLPGTPGGRDFAALLYREPVVSAIHRLKYQGATFVLPVLGGFLNEAFTRLELFRVVDCLVPVPLHPVRFRDRGFNQAELLAREILRHYDFPLLTRVLVRTRHTPSQTRLPEAARRRNVAGAFRVRSASELAGRTCLLVDDVTTTGATLAAARDTLLAAGAAEVLTLALARS